MKTNNEIIPFDFKGRNVRVIKDENNNPWFIAKDICDILKYKKSRNAIAQHCKYAKLLKRPELGTPFGMSIIPESDVYKLILNSRMPEAEKFQDWVVEEVLPSIRKYGGYVHNIDMFIDTFFKMTSEEEKPALRKILEDNIKSHKKIEEDKHKVDFYTAVTGCNTSVDVGVTSKVLAREFDFNIGRNRLFSFLRDQKVLDDKNIPYQKFVDRGYFEVAEIHKEYPNNVSQIYFQTKVFQKGIEFVYKLLKDNNEQEDEY